MENSLDNMMCTFDPSGAVMVLVNRSGIEVNRFAPIDLSLRNSEIIFRSRYSLFQ